MSEDIENLIRRWADAGETPAAPAPPTEACLTFAQAERIASGRLTREPQLADHIAQCPRCRKLLADFEEAIAESAPRPATRGSCRRPGAFTPK